MQEFNLQDVWNAQIERNDRELKPRDYIYASELGGSMIDRYLKMKGVAYTNPPNSRSMRKFMAGDTFEWIVSTILTRAGIKFTTQDKVSVQFPNQLRISGKIDFIINPDEQGEIAIDDEMPEFMKGLIKAIGDNIKKYPKKIIEVKSLGSYVFEALLAVDNPKTNHMYQGWVYGEATGLDVDIIYICRDDMRILQYSLKPIMDGLKKEVQKDVEEITKYYTQDITPEIEKLIIFENGKFAKNWKVEYSNYLSMLYTYETKDEEGAKIIKSFEDPMEYYEWAQPIVSAFNRVIKRIEEGKELTKSNQEHIANMLKFGYDINKIVTKK